MRRYIGMAALAAAFFDLYGCQPAGPARPTASSVKPPEADTKPPPPDVKPATVEPVVDKDQAIAIIQKEGGFVTLDEKVPGKPVVGVDLSGGRVTDAGLKMLAPLKGLQTLKLDYNQVTDGALRSLREIGLLQALSRAVPRTASDRPALRTCGR